jgi:Repeat of unknown function (DUF5650)
MKAIMNYSKAIVGVRGLALCLVFFVMLMNVLPVMSQEQAASGALTNSLESTSQIDIAGPAGSGRFGTSVTALPNGNFVVTDPHYSISSPTPIANVGAVYLYNGATGARISMLTGSARNDLVGSGRVTVLSNGNYVVRSPDWNVLRGAVTWGNATTGISGVVSAANSLVGSTPDDQISSNGVTALANGNYVVRSLEWNSGAGAVTWGNGTTGISGVVSATNSLVGSLTSDSIGFDGVIVLTNGNYVVRSSFWNHLRGAVTWGSAATGISGVVSAANSLVGSTPGDRVGFVFGLTNGNYVVCSPVWHNGAITDAGAATWANGMTGISGPVSPANSLVGSTAGDFVGADGATALTNGNYVVDSSYWNGFRGAVTWANGTTGISGLISIANSLVGSTYAERVGSSGVTGLTNGNYVVSSPGWDNGALADVGAATWANGATGLSGPVTAANSLIGSTAGDTISLYGTNALTNGNYVVRSPAWNGFRGAVTWGNGTTGTIDLVSPANSLVGSTPDDQISSNGVTALANGNYVVRSPGWDNDAINDAGAVTWGNGATGISGPVSAANSLVGSTKSGFVGLSEVTVLANGNYVVKGALANAGAVTWGNGTTGISGPISAANSLVGEGIGSGGVTALANGNYVVTSPAWNGKRGAVTWANGATGISGMVSAANSLVGSIAFDEVGLGDIRALANGNYVVRSAVWNNGMIEEAGAVTFGKGSNGATVGPITATNSVLGTVEAEGNNLAFAYDSTNQQLVVGRPASNIVTLFRVAEFDLCLQDDSNANTSVAFNTQTGDYLFCVGGTQYSGTGKVTRRGNTTTLQHNAGDRRVQVNVDTSANRATASFQKLGASGGIFSLTDRDISNDTCPCLMH